MTRAEKIKNALSVPEAIQARRSIRKYTEDSLPDEDLHAILEFSGKAPSSNNIQPWRVICVRCKQKLKELQDTSMEQLQIGRSAATFVVYSDMKDALSNLEEIIHPGIKEPARSERLKLVRDSFEKMSREDQEIWGMGQTYIFLGYMQLIIESIGYSSSSMLGFYPDQVKKLFGLEEHIKIAALLSMGKPAEEGFTHHRHPADRILRVVDRA